MKEYILKEEVLEIVKTLPSDIVYDHIAELKGIWVDEETGRWIEGADGSAFCSECGTEWLSDQVKYYKFCPICGKQMEN